MSQMRALVAPFFCSPDAYEVFELPQPQIEKLGDVLVKVYAASINPHDVKQASGMTKFVEKISFPFKMGKDLSGVVVDVGPSVSKFKIGDAVFGMQLFGATGAGTICEFAVLHEDELVLKPMALSHVEAASSPLVLYTATAALDKANELLKDGLKDKSVFIPAALSGTGSMAVQLAKHVYGASHVISTISTSKRSLITPYLGDRTLDQIIDYKTQDIHKDIPPASVDFVFDTQGFMTSLIPFVKPTGVLVSIASIPPSHLAKKEMAYMPFWLKYVLDLPNWYYSWKLRGKDIHYEYVFGAHRNGTLEKVEGWVSENKWRPVIGKVADLSDLEAVRDGCRQVYKGTGGVGKFVIRMVNDSTN